MPSAVALVLLVAAAVPVPNPAPAVTAAPAADSSRATETCILDAVKLPVPVVALSPAWLDSTAQAHARFNARQLARIDSLFRAGHYGSPELPEARRRAHLMARLTTTNAYRDLIRLACDSTRVYEANEATLRGFAANYSDAILFSPARLERVRWGLGHVCMHYAVGEKGQGIWIHGGKSLRWRIKDAKVDGQERRLLSIELPTGLDDVVEVMLAPHHDFAVEYERVDGPPAPYEWFLVHDIRGGWLQKWGTHRPTAYMFWVTPLAAARRGQVASSPAPGAGPAAPTPAAVADSATTLRGIATSDSAATRQEGTNGSAADATAYTLAAATDYPATDGDRMPATDLPAVPLAGVRLYIPHLRLRLPLFIPDINFDDLREIELPMPILDLESLRQHRLPDWIRMDASLGFRDWKGYGPVPPAIRLRFPED